MRHASAAQASALVGCLPFDGDRKATLDPIHGHTAMVAFPSYSQASPTVPLERHDNIPDSAPETPALACRGK